MAKGRRQQAEKQGRLAETLAIWGLRLKGYRILAHRFRCPRGEVDIIAKRGHTIAVIEVKARKTDTAALESLSRQQRHRIEGAFDYWLQKEYRPPSGFEPLVRFDLIAVIGPWRFHHHQNAWRSGD